MSATVKTLVNQPYKYGFVTNIEATIPRGLSEDVVRLISAKKRTNRSSCWSFPSKPTPVAEMTEPTWPSQVSTIDYQDIIYYSAPKQRQS